VAYVDPGNSATNIQGGAQYGYLLLWVVLAANLPAPREPAASGDVADGKWYLRLIRMTGRCPGLFLQRIMDALLRCPIKPGAPGPAGPGFTHQGGNGGRAGDAGGAER
jgi:hypothetical protein